MFALPERCIGEPARQTGAMVQGAGVAPIDLIGVSHKVIVAQCLQALQHWIVLELGCPESVESLGMSAAGGLAPSPEASCIALV